MLYEWFSRARFFFAGKPRRDFAEVVQFHIKRQVEAKLAAGMSPSDAQREAAIAFGGGERTREQCREERPSFPLEALLRDLRYGVRGLFRNPGFAAVAVLTIALAI